MANFAQLDENDFVINVIVVNNDDIIDDNGFESEEKGIDFCKSLFGQDTIWLKTSYNAAIRKNYASIGGKYDRVRDIFVSIEPTCHPVDVSFNENFGRWECSNTEHNKSNFPTA
jgi:hypothetical protein